MTSTAIRYASPWRETWTYEDASDCGCDGSDDSDYLHSMFDPEVPHTCGRTAEVES